MASGRATNGRFTSVALSLPPNPDRYQDELLDGYVFIEDIDTVEAEDVEFTRAGQHAMALPRVRAEGLRRPAFGFWRELVVFCL